MSELEELTYIKHLLDSLADSRMTAHFSPELESQYRRLCLRERNLLQVTNRLGRRDVQRAKQLQQLWPFRIAS